MASRRQAHCARRRIHSQMRAGIVPSQEGASPAEGPDGSPKAQKAAKAQKARKP